MNNNRTAKIASIIEQRRPLKEKIGVVKANINTLASNLRTLAECRDRLMTQVDDQNVAVRLKEINFLTLQQQIAEELAALTKLEARFSRDTLNIGVVGLMGQGKSTLLQSLSGLTDDEIPARKGGACTAVRSIICHQEGQTYAEVTIHSEDSFLEEVISPYYKELDLGSTPTSLDAFARPLPPLPNGNATKNSMYDHLQRDYHQNLQQYRHFLNSGLPRKLSPIPKEEIPKYVIQQRDGLGDLISFNHLTVRQVEIFCPFKNSEVGKIALVDVPGLGDTRLGDENLMLKTLGEEVDLVIFVRRPDALRYGWEKKDTDLYKAAAEALPDLASRSFMVLNLVTGDDNSVGCKHHQDTIRDKHINVVQSTIANCSKPESANEVLDLVLNYLVDNITYLDQKSSSLCQDRITAIQNQVNLELAKAYEALGQSTKSESDSPIFVPLFNQLWKKLTNDLEELLKELRKNRDEVDIDFKAQVDAAIQACRDDTGIPSIEQIEERNNIEGGYPIAYGKYLNEIRAHLSEKFLSLDEGLKRSLNRVKSQVAEVLISQVGLGNLTEARGVAFINAITTQLPEELIPGQKSKIKFGFKLLAEFELSYRGLVQHRIRQHLDGLTPNEPVTKRLSKSPNAQQVLSCLKTAHAEAVYKCGNALEELLCEPSQAAFAIVEEFLDRILRAADVKDEWQIFLDDVKVEVWSKEFLPLRQLYQLRREWLNSVEQVESANQLDCLRFLN